MRKFGLALLTAALTSVSFADSILAAISLSIIISSKCSRTDRSDPPRAFRSAPMGKAYGFLIAAGLMTVWAQIWTPLCNLI